MKNQKANEQKEQMRISEFKKEVDDIRKTVDRLTQMIEEGLYMKKEIKLSNPVVMDVYNTIYRLSDEASNLKTISNKDNASKMENELLEQFKKFITDYLDRQVKIMKEQGNAHEQILFTFVEHYNSVMCYIYTLKKMYYYMDKFITPSKNTNLSSIGLNLIKEKYFQISQNQFIETIFFLINEYRVHFTAIPKQMRDLIKMFEICDQISVDLHFSKETGVYEFNIKNTTPKPIRKIYTDVFQRQLLVNCEKYYKDQISLRGQLQTPEFVDWAQKIMAREEELVSQFYPLSKQAIYNKLELCFIKEQAAQLVSSKTGVYKMLQDDLQDQIQAIYVFVKRVPDQMQHIAREFQKYFDCQGMVINSLEYKGSPIESAEVYFQNIIYLMDRAQQILEERMNNDLEIQKAMNIAFGLVLNKNDKTPLWLSIYADLIVKQDKGDQSQIDKKIRNVLRIFKQIYHRDVFFKHYQKFLGIRLLQTHINLDLEKQIIVKFKGETGTNALSQLNMMINDIEQSQRFGEEIRCGKDFTVSLLSQGCWSVPAQVDAILHPQMEALLTNYQDKYLQKYQGRLVNWSLAQGLGELTYKVENDKYFLQVNTLQMILFLKFNQQDKYAIQDLIAQTKINKESLENSLIPFVCLKILKRQKPDLEEFDEAELITLSLDYSNKQKKLKLLPNPKMQPKRTQVVNKQLCLEEQQMLEAIQKQREQVVDAQLVRLMKSRKEMKHLDLLKDTENMIEIFKPDTGFIKKRIESLIDREYFKRDENDWYYIIFTIGTHTIT